MQVTIARQLGLDPSTVSNFFMNARRRSVDKWREDDVCSPPPSSSHSHPRMLLVTSSGSGSGAVAVHAGGELSPSNLNPSGMDL